MTSPVLDGARAHSHQRKILRCRAVLHFSDGHLVQARTTDVSTAGMSLLSAQSLAAGMTCRIVFQIAVAGKLHDVVAGVEVVYNTCQGTDGFRLGLRFTAPDSERSRLINRLQ